MKLWFLFSVLSVASVLHGADFAAWTHRQSVHVAQPGLTRLELDPKLLDASRSQSGGTFHDLRLLNPQGVEAAYVILLPQLTRHERMDAIDFKSMLTPNTTVLEFMPPTREVIHELVLETPVPQFTKAATVLASADGQTWQTLAHGQVLCRQAGLEHLRLPIPPARWARFRVLIDDRRTSPVIFAGAQVRRELTELRTVPHEVKITQRSEVKEETHLTLDLGSAHVFLNKLRLQTPEFVFQREVTLLGKPHTIFRLKHEGLTGENVEIPVQQVAPTREVKLVVRNGSNQPLEIESLQATRHPVPLVFQADVAGEWQLFVGNAQAPEPRYDLAKLSTKLQDAATSLATADPVKPNAAFRKTATAPEVGETGITLDTTAWAFRRPVQLSEAGVVELELPPEVLAQAANDLHDLRIIRAGKQLPFLVVRPGTQLEVKVAFSHVLDERRASLSKWAVTLPCTGFPATELVLESSTPLFERTLSVQELRETEQGRTVRRLGSAHWQRKPSYAPQPLHVALPNPPRGNKLLIETDNGDNAPLELQAVRVLYPATRLLFRVPNTEPVHLCYGHARAPYPRYDLQLVRREFESATKTYAQLSEEEKLPGYQAPPQQRRVGSPWLWLALTAVVAVLLRVVARLLPKQEAPP